MEHALIFASIIVGVAVTDQMISLNRLLRARRQVAWDWAAPAVALLVLLTVVQIWWSIAQPSAGPVTIGQFLPILVELILLFLLCSASLPDEVPAGGLSLRDFYREQAPYIWSLYSIAFAWVLAVPQVVAAAAGKWAARDLPGWAEFVVLALMVSLIFVRRRWWHAVALLLLASGPVGWLSRSLT